ncbi:sulfotransferase [Sphingomonas swuensis]|uniref:Sulfotransferase n=1 Tax=Sphingomonas swuensis TaxID=977800 RepID=A0ABP7SQW8_9SPHN
MTDDLRLLRLANRSLGRLPPVTLDPERIEAYVCRRQGLSRVPGTHWRPAFAALCESLHHEARLSPLGRIMANGQLVGLLKARCRAERLLARHPEIHEQPIAAPIIIMGPMRSGSTRVQRLLACDPRLAWTRLHETLFPVPSGRRDRKRIAAAATVHAILRTLNPAVQQLHPSGPMQPDEEFGYLSFAFHSGQFAVQWDLPGFLEQEESRDLLPVAAELRTLLRINAWARGESGQRRWVLKCPAYSGMAEALIATFPDAQLVCLSRDPLKVVASSASLVHQQRRIHSDAADARAIGPEWLERTARRQRQLAAVRTLHPEVPAFDLHYDTMTADWRGAMHRLYRFLGLSLTGEVMAAMERYISGAKEHRGHRYALADYGLDPAMVEAAFAQPERPLFPVSSPPLAVAAE